MFVKLKSFSINAAICDPEQDAETAHGPDYYMPTTFGTVFRNMQFAGHHSYLKKGFYQLLAVQNVK